MAYLFGDPDDEQQKTNIFQQDQPTVAAPNAQQSPAGSGSSGTSGSGGVSSGSGGVSSAPTTVAAPAQNMASPSPSNVSSKMASLSARQKAPDLSGISSNLSSNEQKLQSEADSYIQGNQQSAQKQTFDQKQADSAIGGDLEAMTALKSRLSKTQADQVEGFKGVGADYKPQASQLVDPYSQAGLLRGSNSSYTGGQQAFDARLLGRNQAFQTDAKGLVDRENALLKSSDAQKTDLTKQAQGLQQTYLDIGNQQFRTYLGNSNKDLAGDLQTREMIEEGKRADLNPYNIGLGLGQEVLGKIKDDSQYLDKNTLPSKALAADRFNPNQDFSKYLDIDRDVDWQELVSQKEAERYNRVMGLLGDGGTPWQEGHLSDPYNANSAKDLIYKQIFGEGTAKQRDIDDAAAKAAEEARNAPKPTVTRQVLDDPHNSVNGSPNRGDIAGAGITRTTNPDGSYTEVSDSGVTIEYNADGSIKNVNDPKKVLT